MKAWRARSSSGGGFGRSSGASVAHVVSVVTNGGGFVDWTFDRVVVSVGDASFMTVNADPSVGVDSGLGTMTVTLLYASGHNAGEAWDLDQVNAALVFSPAATIADATGLTT